MPDNVMLPHWGMEMTEATVVRWLKREGDAVKKGEPIAELETEKASGELESPYAGVLARILAQAGTVVEVGKPVAVIAQPGEKVDIAAAPASPTPTGRTAEPPSRVSQPSSPNMQVEPAARRLAQQKNVDLATVRGTGPGGRITLEDVQRAAAAPVHPSTGSGRTGMGVGVEMTGLRAVVAKRMLLSAQQSAPVTLTREIDVTDLEALRPAMRSQRIDRLAVFIKAVAESLKEYPGFNGYVRDMRLDLRKEVYVGFAVNVAGGIMVPVIRGADGKSAQQISAEARELGAKAASSGLGPTDTGDGTFTITSLATEGVDAFTPIINPPEIAILGLGRIAEKAAVVRGEVVPRAMMWLSLTFDHRAADGVGASRFLKAIGRRLEEPGWLGLG